MPGGADADAGSGAEPLAGGPAAEAEVGGEQHRREEHEESERDGDRVPEAERGERVKEGHGSLAPHVVVVGGGGGGAVVVGRDGMLRGGGAEWEEGICLRELRFPGGWIWLLAALIAGEGGEAEKGNRSNGGGLGGCTSLPCRAVLWCGRWWWPVWELEEWSGQAGEEGDRSNARWAVTDSSQRTDWQWGDCWSAAGRARGVGCARRVPFFV